MCLKIAFRQLCVPLCGRFGPDEGGVAGYLPCLLINPSFRPLGGNKVDKNRKFLIRFVQIVE
ncbi:hypothetical protein DW886_11710 [Enterocloster aldenensis]|uniref:DUF6783 domain-containing protein n=1 Tax=Enterocloster aldenensis TaxID=358742 RepID=UPI000E4791B9|nr:hypothetical protein DW886_11710 [Enterocloster aldenensis]